ncbi:hypothetical protein [Cupriavidus basilensis]
MQTTAIYPLLFMLVLSVFGAQAARWGFHLGLAASVFMAVTLLAGNYHTLSETLAGMAVGAMVVCTYLRWQPSLRPAHLSLLVALPVAVVLLVDMHGTVNPTKAALWQRAAVWLGATEQYTRQIYTDPVNGTRRVFCAAAQAFISLGRVLLPRAGGFPLHRRARNYVAPQLLPEHVEAAGSRFGGCYVVSCERLGWRSGASQASPNF